MAGFDAGEVFSPILKKIQQGDIKTAHQLRLVLDVVGEKHDVTTLNMLLLLREWLGEQGLDISTANGCVVLVPADAG